MRERNHDLVSSDACLTSHILDLGSGRPAGNIPVALLRESGSAFTLLKEARSNGNGRFDTPLLTTNEAEAGKYRLVYAVSSAFFDSVTVDFNISDTAAHHHVPLVLSPFGFSVYRGAPPHRPPRDFGFQNGHPPPPAEGVAPLPGTGGAGLTIHAIDIAGGTGAGGLQVHLFGGEGSPLGSQVTTGEGRTPQWLVAAGELAAGIYELAFDIGTYFAGPASPAAPPPFFETARVRFRVTDRSEHHHLPLIAAPWGYSCYRGS